MTEEKELTPDERMQWLRDRGILIETPEERKANANVVTQTDSNKQDGITYVCIPSDTNLSLQEMEFTPQGSGDFLMEHLKSTFAKKSHQNVDLNLLQQPALQSSSDTQTSVSQETLKQVAEQGHVEVFPLVHANPSNKFVGVNIYLDEIGMLKRLPLNKRASDYARLAGYDPPPQFYGDVYVGRIRKSSSQQMVQNVAFPLTDANPKADWLQQAASQNLVYQMEMNKITGRSDTQPTVDGSNGVAKEENEYSWTQTEEEIEIVATLPLHVTSKDIQVKFKPRKVDVKVKNTSLVSIDLFEPVDVDGCTWTLEKSKDTLSIVVSMEKVDEALWPRIKN